MSKTAEGKIPLVLESSDGTQFQIQDRSVVVDFSTMIREMVLTSDAADAAGAAGTNPIKLSSVSTASVEKILEWCKYHHGFRRPPKKDEDFKDPFKPVSQDICPWDYRLLKDVAIDPLLDLVKDANFLMMEELHDLCCQTVAEHIKNKSPQEIRELFGITNDLTMDDVEKLQREGAWFKDLGTDVTQEPKPVEMLNC